MEKTIQTFWPTQYYYVCNITKQIALDQFRKHTSNAVG